MRFIFLDLDDTILDFHRAERQALSQTLRHFHVDPTDAVLDRYHVLNRRQWELLEEGKLTRPQVLVRRFQLLFDELGIRAAPQEVCQLYEEQLAQGHFFVPGAQELLEALHTRYELYLATNGTPEVQNSRIESAGIARYFQNIFISEQMGAYKPSPAFFHACFAAIPDFDAAEAMMVGDSLTSDIRGARNVGLRSCWYNPQYLPAPAGHPGGLYHRGPAGASAPAGAAVSAIEKRSPAFGGGPLFRMCLCGQFHHSRI